MKSRLPADGAIKRIRFRYDADAGVRTTRGCKTASYLDVRSISGLNLRVNRSLTKQVCELIKYKIGIPGNRVHVGFESSTPVDRRWVAGTFG